MSSLYSKEYLQTVSETKLKNYIDGKIPIDFSDSYNRKDMTVLQHYLIKYIETYGKTKQANEILKKFYIAFGENPALYINSPLLKNNFIDRYMPDDMKNKIKTFRGAYFDENIVMQLYEKSKKYELSEREKYRLYSYLIIQLKAKDKKYEDICKDCAKRILNTNKKVNELNDMELEFYCAYIGKLAWGERKEPAPEIHIMKDAPNLGGYECRGMIYINKNTSFTPTLEEITQTVCHETQHRVQEISSIKTEDRTAFEMARHQLFNKYLSTKEYDVYHANYNYSDIELDAEKSGFFNASVFLGMLDRRDLSDRLREIRVKRFDKRHYYEFMINKDNKKVPADTFVVEYLTQIIKEHPEELKQYKVLNNIYEPNGQIKSFGNILVRRMNQTLETRGIYDNYVNYGIHKDMLDKLKFDKSTLKDRSDLFKSLSNVYRDSALLFKDYCNDKDYKNINPGQISQTTLYQLGTLTRIANFIDNNMNLVLETKEESQINNRSYIFNFIYDFRDFDLTKIDNEVIRNNPNIQERYRELKNKVDSIIKKFNKEYIKDRIKDIPLDKLKSTIKTPEGAEMSLDDYLYFDALPRMDGHMEIEINGRKVYISDIIKYYKNNLNKTNEDITQK